ncbi:MAG: porin [Syntrophobacteraceae bacterium]|jgi:phosphate-selective porin OprO/OprP
MNCFLKLGQKVMLKALTVTVLLCAFTVFMGGWAFAQEKSVAEKILDIMLKNHEISQEQYNDLLNQAKAEQMAAAQKIAEAQKAAVAKIAALPPAERQPTDFRAWFNKSDGLHFTTEDKAFDLHVGGRIQFDIADAEPDRNVAAWGANTSAFKSSHGSSAPVAVGGYGDQLRRVRLDIDGTLWNNIEFIIQPDFAPSYKITTGLARSTNGSTANLALYDITTGAAVTFADVWVGVKDIPYIGRIKVGQMYEPISIEQMTSDNWNTFMEKALPVNAFIPGRMAGIETQNTICNDRIGWMVGYYFQQQVAVSSNGVPLDTTGDLFSPHLDATQVATRLVALPWYENNGEHLIHLGIGYTHEFRSDIVSTSSGAGFINPGTLDFKSSPEANLYSPLVDSGYFLARSVDIIDPEFAMVFGPFSMQAEYIYAMVHDVENYQTGAPLSKTQSNASFYGWYAQASYFLTGEHRNYAKTASPATYQETFGRVYPNHNFDPRACGLGAWELAFRISQLDVNDFNAGFFGGMETDITAGLNWYLNPNVMVKMNFVHAMVDAHSQGNSTANYYGLMPTSGTDNIFETRFQIAF